MDTLFHRFFRPCLFGGIAILFLLLLSCGHRNPLDIPDAQWQMMTPEQQLQARNQQAELDRALVLRKAEEARQRAAEAEARKAELDAMRRNAPYGDRVQCVFEGAQTYFNRNWQPILPLGLDLVRGYEEAIVMEISSSEYLRMPIEAYALFDGQVVSLCRFSGDNTYRREHCAILVGTRRDFQQGIVAHVYASDFLRGRLRCDHPPSENVRQIMIN
ncbi:hypothetical protein [Desulfonatronum sp. SC1]|uniref:hypothetical protein n=1 Tax=Desulfonatronum sp. SC1 TaxID=2109626 RepID=UPI0011B23907|nr:hypothetical protein [Desulfonatronum sp. SC1]